MNYVHSAEFPLKCNRSIGGKYSCFKMSCTVKDVLGVTETVSSLRLLSTGGLLTSVGLNLFGCFEKIFPKKLGFFILNFIKIIGDFIILKVCSFCFVVYRESSVRALQGIKVFVTLGGKRILVFAAFWISNK